MSLRIKGFTLGQRARDKISGWEGILAGRFEYLNGCVRYEIGGTDKDGKPESFVFDEQQIEVIGNGLLASLDELEPKAEPRRRARTGGPRGNRPPAR